MVIKFHLEGESELGAPQPAVALLLGVVEDELSTKGFQIISHYLYRADGVDGPQEMERS